MNEEMELIEIYNDGSTIIEISKVFNDYLRNRIVKHIALNNNELDGLMQYIFDELQSYSINLKGCGVKVSSKVPIIEKNRYIELIEPFNLFDYAFNYLAFAEDFMSAEDLEEEIFKYYDEQNIPFLIRLYDIPNNIVDGYMITKVDNDFVIAFIKKAKE